MNDFAVRKSFFWLAVGGLLLRLAYLTEHAGSAFFDIPILDEKYYDAVATDLVEGRSIADINPGFRPLLYPLILEFIYQLGGDWGRILAISGQHLLGVATALLVAVVAFRLYRRRAAAMLAGMLYLLAAPPLFFEGELLITTLFTFLVTIQLVLVSRLERPAGWLGAGAFTALAAQARPNVLPFLVAYPVAALFGPRSNALPEGERDSRHSSPSAGRHRQESGAAGRGAKMKRAAMALAGALAVLIAWGWIGAHFTGHFQAFGGSGGVNLYLGNKRGADGMIPRQDRAVTYGAEYRDSVQVFAFEVYREELERAGAAVPERLEPAEVSRYWTARTFEEIRADPAAWARLVARKLGYLAGAAEIPNNKNLAFVREHESTLLRHLPIHWWMLVALAPLGALFAWRRGDRRILIWIALFVVLYAAGVVLFFVNSRYRLPLWPALSVLAAGGILELASSWQRRRVRAVAWRIAAAGALAAASLALGAATPLPDFGRDFFFRSLAHFEKGRLEEAAADARRAVELDPGEAAAHFQLATVALAADRPNEAIAGFERAAELTPGEARIWNNLGVAHERLGRSREAYRAYRRSLALAADYPPALVNAALLELRAGLVEQALASLEQAASMGFRSVSFHAARAFAAQAGGRPQEAAWELEAARSIDPEATERLIAESRRPIDPRILLEPSG